MFEELSERQLQQLETVWNTAAKSVHWREILRYDMSKALATGCILEHLAAVTIRLRDHRTDLADRDIVEYQHADDLDGHDLAGAPVATHDYEHTFGPRIVAR
jgi:hypothetical protein